MKKGLIFILCFSVSVIFLSFLSTEDLLNYRPSGEKADSSLVHYEKIKKALQNSYQLLPPARTGEWLDVHKEKFQSFADYIKSKPVRPDGTRNKIYIQPIGAFDSTGQKIILETAAYLKVFFSLEVTVNKAVPDTVIPKTSRRTLNGTEQLHTKYILDKVLRPLLPSDAATMIAITNYDLYPEEKWNYVFGQASVKERVGVWSLARFGDPHANTAAYLLCLERTLKTASHETGHMFSIPHCTKYKCVMNGSNSLEESDGKPLFLCPDCICKLCWNTGITEKEFVKKQMGFWKNTNYKESLVYYTKCAKSLAEH